MGEERCCTDGRGETGDERGTMCGWHLHSLTIRLVWLRDQLYEVSSGNESPSGVKITSKVPGSTDRDTGLEDR